MACESWRAKLDAYLDGELPEAEARDLYEHLRSCAACAAESLSRVQFKRAVQSAGQRYKPDPAFRARIEKSIATSGAPAPRRLWLAILAAGLMAFSLTLGLLLFGISRQPRTNPQLSELADLYVATLASSNPVDVVSTDRHTVKPWFEGKIPFTFNLPELEDTPFTLVGGKVAYLNQAPGAELIFRIRQHQISLFIFQERALPGFRGELNATSVRSFTLRSWIHNGLRYFAISDVAAPDLDKLAELMKSAE
jgi:anti-sigma factor RsiW